MKDTDAYWVASPMATSTNGEANTLYTKEALREKHVSTAKSQNPSQLIQVEGMEPNSNVLGLQPWDT